MTTHRRRWFRFSLRTLFVLVTGLACWLGWELRLKRDRQACRQDIEATCGSVIDCLPNELAATVRRKPVFDISLGLWLVGERPVQVILLAEEHIGERPMIAELFPESVVRQFGAFQLCGDGSNLQPEDSPASHVDRP